jgi:Cu/Ag efflux pump CusA
LGVYAERVTGGNFLSYRINREEAACYGLTVGDVQDVIMMLSVPFSLTGGIWFIIG